MYIYIYTHICNVYSYLRLFNPYYKPLENYLFIRLVYSKQTV